MEAPTTKLFGAGTVVGAVLALVVSVPSSWYGTPETDAYLFDPATYSPLWIERSLVPVMSLLAVLLLGIGLAVLVARDWSVAGRLRRWGGVLGALGVGMLTFTTLTFATSGSAAGTDVLGTLFVLLGALVGLVAVVVVLAGLIAAGVGYLRADRRVLGYALVVGQAVTGVTTAVGLAADFPEVLGFLPAAVPFTASFVAVGWELWTHPGAVGQPTEVHGDAGGADDATAESASADAVEDGDPDADSE
jgi:hypothetical protein